MSRTMIISNANDQTTQRLVGTWENAIAILRRNESGDELRQHARAFIVNCVEQVAAQDGAPGEMCDWSAEGDLYDSDTPESVAAEWDDNQRRYQAERDDQDAD